MIKIQKQNIIGRKKNNGILLFIFNYFNKNGPSKLLLILNFILSYKTIYLEIPGGFEIIM